MKRILARLVGLAKIYPKYGQDLVQFPEWWVNIRSRNRSCCLLEVQPEVEVILR